LQLYWMAFHPIYSNVLDYNLSWMSSIFMECNCTGLHSIILNDDVPVKYIHLYGMGVIALKRVPSLLWKTMQLIWKALIWNLLGGFNRTIDWEWYSRRVPWGIKSIELQLWLMCMVGILYKLFNIIDVEWYSTTVYQEIKSMELLVIIIWISLICCWNWNQSWK